MIVYCRRRLPEQKSITMGCNSSKSTKVVDPSQKPRVHEKGEGENHEQENDTALESTEDNKVENKES
ncbi:hypothetical protein XENTR_v10011412 [Xenopus tropicalis]|nr:hypothetical protein XENTR_v10011412 [Xenopus tropicalis]